MPLAPRPSRPLDALRLMVWVVVLVVAAVAVAAVAAVPQARADVGALTATNVSRVPVTRSGVPLAPGIGRVRATYDPAGVVGMDLTFAHPLNRVTHARYFAWTLALRFGASVPGSLSMCRSVIAGTVGLGSGQGGTLTRTGRTSLTIAPTIRRTALGFAVGDARVAGANVGCLAMSMFGWRHAAAGTRGARRVGFCGCWATSTVVDRLRDGSGQPAVWFPGRRPVPPPPPLGAPTPRVAWIATVTTDVVARSGPGTGHPIARLGASSDIDGGPDALMVLGAARDPRHRLWVRVRLDLRPNTASGWIPAAAADLMTTPWRIVVSLGTTTVRVFDAGHLRYRFRAVIGKPSTPTPTGLFAVAAIVPQSDPRGFLGPVALHLTAHSNVLDNYGGGPGRVAIHGRGGASLLDPLGSARSHGCIRVNNNWATRLADTVPVGTPVLVH